MAAFYDGLRLTENGKFTIEWVTHSELLWDWYHIDTLAITNKDAWLRWTNKDVTVLTAVDIHTCVRVE